MSWVQRGLIVGIVGLGLWIVIGKTGARHAALEPAESPIKGATFAGQVPIVSGAKLGDEMGGNYYDDLGGPVTFTSHSWFFELSTPLDEALAFYASRLPDGARRVEAEEGTTAYQWRPPGSAEGEEVTVRISAGSLQVTEVVKAKSQ